MPSIFSSCFSIFNKSSSTRSKSSARMPDSDVEVDWSSWSPPGNGEVRSPCPALNALANHSILPHDGRNISKAMAVKALTTTNAINLSTNIASVFACAAVAANPDHQAHTFNLDHTDKHGFIEHDVSLSRNDVALGSNSEFSHDRWKKVYEIYADSGASEVSYDCASRARYARVQESKKAHEKIGESMEYGVKEALLSYGETALWMNVLSKDGVVPLEYLRVFFEEERFPYAEGWRPSARTIDQSMITQTILELVAANEHKEEEAIEIGLGSVRALEAAIESMLKMPSMCSVM